MNIKHVIRLIRLPNLLMMAFIMVLMRYCIVQPFAIHFGANLSFPLPHFLLLILSVAMIAAAGYIINDYFDVKTDKVNRPYKVVIGRYISDKAAYNAYVILNLMAVCITLYLSLSLKMIRLFAIFPVVIGLLWFYSTTYKKQLLIGNILIAAITAGVPLLVALFEIPAIYLKYHDYFLANQFTLNAVFLWIGMFSFFAFMMNLIRELVKDLEDISGDQATGRNTLPIAYGINVTKVVVATLIALVIATLSHIFFHFLNPSCTGKFNIIPFFYFLVLLFVPLIVVMIMVFRAKIKKQYTLISTFLKILMVIGVLYAIVAKFNIDSCSLYVP